jgi:hypothetical protein
MMSELRYRIGYQRIGRGKHAAAMVRKKKRRIMVVWISLFLFLPGFLESFFHGFLEGGGFLLVEAAHRTDFA